MTAEIRAVLFLFLAVIMGGIGTLYALYRSANDRVAVCEVSIAKQNIAIEALGKTSQDAIKAQKQRDKKAQAQADTDAHEISNQMRAEVPKECEEAIHWMVLESQNMRPK